MVFFPGSLFVPELESDHEKLQNEFARQHLDTCARYERDVVLCAVMGYLAFFCWPSGPSNKKIQTAFVYSKHPLSINQSMLDRSNESFVSQSIDQWIYTSMNQSK